MTVLLIHDNSNPEHTFAEMSVDTHIASSAGQALVFSVHYMLMSSWVDKLFRESEVYYVYYVVFLARCSPDEKIFGLHVTINEIL